MPHKLPSYQKLVSQPPRDLEGVFQAFGAENTGTAKTQREKKPADESNGLCENNNTKNEKGKGDFSFPKFQSETILQ